jgi:hypothetical protein
VDLVGEVCAGVSPGGEERFSAEEGARRLARRGPREDLAPHPELPEDTRLWAALIQASGGVWGGCVYDAEAIIARLQAGSIDAKAEADPLRG